MDLHAGRWTYTLKRSATPLGWSRTHVCTSNDDCPADHVCAHTVLYDDCETSGLEDCNLSPDGQCDCSHSSDCQGRFDCVPIEEVTCEDNVVSCGEDGGWRAWQAMFEIMLGAQDTPELQALAERCADRIAELEECLSCFAPTHNDELICEESAHGCACEDQGEPVCWSMSGSDPICLVCQDGQWTPAGDACAEP
jgi:hypothetical protein